MTDSYDRSQYLERDLTLLEIEERTTLHLAIATERDENLAETEDHRRQIRMLNVSRKKLDLRSAQIRREIRSGKVLEPIPSRQGELGFPEPAPDAFAIQYPKARDAVELHTQLAVVLQGVLVPSIEKLERWAPSTATFEAVAHWVRVELAYMNHRSHPEIDLPPRAVMPAKLDEMRVALQRASKPPRKVGKAAKKAAARRGGARRRAGS